MRSTICLYILAAFSMQLLSQNLPSEVKLYNDGHFMKSGGNTYAGLYDISQVKDIKIYFKESNFWTLLKNNYTSKKNLMATMSYEGKSIDSIGIRFKGQTSYKGGPGDSGSSATSEKKSFDIEIDAFVEGQDIQGYNTLNLNNSYQDPSFMREVFYYDNIRSHTPAAKANFVHLYINDIDWGIYQNVQQLNKDFLKEWWPSNSGSNWRADSPGGAAPAPGGGPGWGDGTAALNYLGSDTSLYKKYYTLKSTDSAQPWSALMKACQLLNNTSAADLSTKLDQYFDVDKILWHLASEVLFSDDDSYIYKGKMDYYLYQDLETGRFTTFDYDGNSSLETKFVNWSPFYNENKVNYPLLNKILANPELRQRYIAHLKTLINEYCDDSKVNEKIEKFANLIESAVIADPKKTSTHEQFLSDKSVLKEFMAERKKIILNNLEFKPSSPIVNEMSFSTTDKWVAPKNMEETLVEVSATNIEGIHAVNLYYGENLYGRFQKMMLQDDGTNGDKKANDNIYTGKIPGYAAGTWIRSYAEVVGKNPARTVTYYPAGAEHDVMVYQVQALNSSVNEIVLNELMATNETGPKDEKGSTADWIELFNKTNNEIDLSGFHLSDNPANLKKFQIPNGIKIPANGYLIFWCDEDQMQGNTHTSFKLSADGETVLLSDTNGALIDSYTYPKATKDKSFARIPNGTGPFVEVANYTFNANNSPNTTINLQAKISIFPNPASSQITIKGYDGTIEFFNMQGNMIFKKTIVDGENIDVTNWQKGIYFYKIIGGIGSVLVD
jgi:hypothetical protein